MIKMQGSHTKDANYTDNEVNYNEIMDIQCDRYQQNAECQREAGDKRSLSQNIEYYSSVYTSRTVKFPISVALKRRKYVMHRWSEDKGE